MSRRSGISTPKSQLSRSNIMRWKRVALSQESSMLMSLLEISKQETSFLISIKWVQLEDFSSMFAPAFQTSFIQTWSFLTKVSMLLREQWTQRQFFGRTWAHRWPRRPRDSASTSWWLSLYLLWVSSDFGASSFLRDFTINGWKLIAQEMSSSQSTTHMQTLCFQRKSNKDWSTATATSSLKSMAPGPSESYLRMESNIARSGTLFMSPKTSSTIFLLYGSHLLIGVFRRFSTVSTIIFIKLYRHWLIP